MLAAASSSTFQRSSTPLFLSPKSATFRPSRISVSCTATATPMASTTSPSPSLYQLLDVPMGATCQEIKTAYRRLARVCHPDVVAINQKNTSADEFMKIHSAYLTLSDPQKRSDYDRNFMFRRHRSFNNSPMTSPSSSPSMASAMSGRNWETDQCW